MKVTISFNPSVGILILQAAHSALVTMSHFTPRNPELEPAFSHSALILPARDTIFSHPRMRCEHPTMSFPLVDLSHIIPSIRRTAFPHIYRSLAIAPHIWGTCLTSPPRAGPGPSWGALPLANLHLKKERARRACVPLTPR
jgi:hypothetical protein